MARLTITYPTTTNNSECAPPGVKSIGQLIEEELDQADDRPARTFLRSQKAWAHADKVRPDATDEEVMGSLMTHDVRRQMADERASRGRK
jgi:hypothetical protein